MGPAELFPIPASWADEPASLLSGSVARWAADRVMTRRVALGESFEELLTPALDALLGEVGLRHLVWPAADTPGPAAPAATLALVLEQVGRADLGLAHVLAGHFALQQAAIGAAARLGPELLAGAASCWAELGAPVLPGYGEPSPAFRGLRAPALAQRRDGAVVLESRGPVRPQCAGADAGWFGVACELDGAPALVVVRADAPGLTRGREPIAKTGLRASRDVELSLAHVVVGEDHLVAAGRDALSALEAWYRLGCAAGCVGALLAAQELLREWGAARVIRGPGQVFRNNPLVASQMGRIGARVAASRLLVHALAALLDDAGGTAASATTAIAVSTTALAEAMQGLDETMELMASAGYATEWQLERPWRDVKTLQTVLGPAPATLAALGGRYFGCEPELRGGPA